MCFSVFTSKCDNGYDSDDDDKNIDIEYFSSNI